MLCKTFSNGATKPCEGRVHEFHHITVSVNRKIRAILDLSYEQRQSRLHTIV